MDNGRRVLLVAATTGYQTRMFVEAAARAGIELLLATDRCHVLEDPWGDHAIPIRFDDPQAAARLVATAANRPSHPSPPPPLSLADHVSDVAPPAAADRRDPQSSLTLTDRSSDPSPALSLADHSSHARLPLAPLADPSYDPAPPPPSAGPLHGIVAMGDRPAYVASVIAAELGLRFHPPTAVAAARNKSIAREAFRAAGLPQPESYRVPLRQTPVAARFYPCVLKPLGLSASRGVIRANNDSEFAAAFRRIRAIVEREELNEFIQIERFIAGREFALEGMVRHGRLRAIAIFDKPDPLDGPFFEETIYVTPSREPPDVQAAIVETAARAVAALGLTYGPVHAEMRVNDRGVWMLEVAARPIGGLCAKALPGLEEFILREACGEDASPPGLDGASGVMMIPIPREGIYRGVSGVEAAEAVAGIARIAITAKEGQHIVPLPEGNSYLGFIFARTASAEEAERALRGAHENLKFEILAALPVVKTAHLLRGGT